MEQGTHDPFNLLVLSFSHRIRDLRGLMLLRTPDSFDAWQDSILDLNNQLLEIEKQLIIVKERTVVEKKLINHINDFKVVLLAQKAELLYVQSHLPARLPGKIIAEPSLVELEKNNILEAHSGPSIPKKADTTKKFTSGTQPPIVPYVSLQELESTPKYMKGRLTLEKVNAAVDELQKLVEEKYKILSLPITKLNDKSLKKYKVYKDMETTETKGIFFVAEPDLADTTHLKQGDATGKALLSVLRHLHRLKDLGGSPKRFVIVG